MDSAVGRVIRAPSLKRGKGDETHISQRVSRELLLDCSMTIFFVLKIKIEFFFLKKQ